MLHGWRLFKFSKELRRGADCHSYCNTNIFPYGQTIFSDERSDQLSIYASASRQLEFLMDERVLEIRFVVWALRATTNILLEKIDVAGAHIIQNGRSIAFGTEEREFTVGFYCEEDADGAYALSNARKAYGRPGAKEVGRRRPSETHTTQNQIIKIKQDFKRRLDVLSGAAESTGGPVNNTARPHSNKISRKDFIARMKAM